MFWIWSHECNEEKVRTTLKIVKMHHASRHARQHSQHFAYATYWKFRIGQEVVDKSTSSVEFSDSPSMPFVLFSSSEKFVWRCIPIVRSRLAFKTPRWSLALCTDSEDGNLSPWLHEIARCKTNKIFIALMNNRVKVVQGQPAMKNKLSWQFFYELWSNFRDPIGLFFLAVFCVHRRILETAVIKVRPAADRKTSQLRRYNHEYS